MKSKSTIIIFIISLVFLFASIIFYTSYRIIEKEEYYIENYKKVLKCQQIKGTVKKRFYTRGNLFVFLNDSLKIKIPWAENFNYKQYFIADFIRINDSIHKPANSDTLYVFREEQKYFFVLEKRINK